MSDDQFSVVPKLMPSWSCFPSFASAPASRHRDDRRDSWCVVSRRAQSLLRRSIALLCVLGATALLPGCGGSDSHSGTGAANTSSTSSITAPSVPCASLLGLQMPNTTITAAQSIPAGSYQPPGSTTAFKNLPAFCRVTANVTPVTGSSIAVELWLPTTWNGRYQQVGNHGWGSGIEWGEMAPQLQSGFVAGATDDGHAPTGGFDVSWVPGFPERLTDFAYRAVHETALNAKLIINAYYAKPASYSYFNGCSSGGREALMEVQKYPLDFNGVIAGSALQNWTRVATQELFVSQQLLQSGWPQGAPGAALLTLAQKSAVTACDAADGVTDGIIRDPRSCHWDPHSLVCSAGQAVGTCLTAPQADGLAASFAPLTDPVTKEVLFSGQSPDSEGDWTRFGYNNGLFVFPVSQYQIAFNDFKWNGSTFNLHTDLPVLEQALGFVDAENPDLSAFNQAGGKIIQWHGWEDGVTMPGAIVRYYDAVRDSTAGGDRSSEQSFYRLFMLPAVGHCGTGAGPANFGAEGQTVVSNDPEHNAVLALQAWVEKGTAPQDFIATKFQNDDLTQPVTMQRPLCPYPSQAVYKGTGDTSNASNFYCG